jgi:uncharacterized protein (TIGR00369 family)
MSERPTLQQLLGLQMDRKDGVVRVDVEPRHRQRNGVVHGSVIHALLDTVMGIECFRSTGRRPVATAEISIHYLVAVFDGTLTARARVIKTGKRLLIVDGEVFRDETCVAIGRATFVPVRETKQDGTPPA